MLDVSDPTDDVLMMDLAKDMGLSYLYITHDLAALHQPEIAVMYMGKIVGRRDETMLSNPLHPYTALFRRTDPCPSINASRRRSGGISQPIDPATLSVQSVVRCNLAPAMKNLRLHRRMGGRSCAGCTPEPPPEVPG
jgi:ABC-type oligopeptide transport system ATPase subunit